MNTRIPVLVAAIFLTACQTTSLQVQKISAQDARLKYHGNREVLEHAEIPNTRAYSEAISIKGNPHIYFQEAYPEMDFVFPLEQDFLRYSKSGGDENMFKENEIEIDRSDIAKHTNKFGEGLYIFKGNDNKYCVSYMVRFGKSGWNLRDSSGTSKIYAKGCGTFASRDQAEKDLQSLLSSINDLQVTK